MKKIITIIVLCITLLPSFALAQDAAPKDNATDNSRIRLLAPVDPEDPYFDVPEYSGEEGGYTIRIVEQYLAYIYPYLAMILIAISVLMTVVGSIEIMTAGGDSGKVTSGKDRILYAIIGLLMFLFASAILWTINPNFFQWTG